MTTQLNTTKPDALWWRSQAKCSCGNMGQKPKAC